MEFKRCIPNLMESAKILALGVMVTLMPARAMVPGQLPAFSLPDLDGKVWNNSQFHGQAVVVDFWATWCATCKETVPKLAELSEKYKGQGLTVIGISVDKGSAEKIRKSAGKLGINYLVLLDQGNTLAETFGFSGIPSLYVFDRQGKLESAMPGYNSEQENKLALATENALKIIPPVAAAKPASPENALEGPPVRKSRALAGSAVKKPGKSRRK